MAACTVSYLSVDRTHEEQYEAASEQDAARFIESMEGLLVYSDVEDMEGNVINI